MSEKHPYEVVGLRPNGDGFTVEVLGEQTKDEAKRLAQHYADLWQHTVNLYRVPFLNLGSEVWAEHQMQFIRCVDPQLTRRDRLRRVTLLCCHFARNLAYHRAGLDNEGHVPVPARRLD
jgi:hypothetical protein